jgi:L-threonylcarbamoyladenylate synthase
MSFREDIDKSIEVLRKGGVILYPTDTIWGLGCDPADESAVEKLYLLKNRPPEKSMIILVNSIAMLERYTVDLPYIVYELTETEQGPLTLVLPARRSLLAPSLISSDGFAGIRICRDEFCSELITRFRKPLVSTSANLSGEPSPAIFSEINQQLIDSADYVVNYRRDDTRKTKPSPVIRIDSNGEIKILRK